MATEYKVDYEDERFQQVDEQHQERVDDVESTYAGIIGNTDQYYDDLINANKEWEATQSQLQQDRTDLTIQQIEQQKEQARKDYQKEQSASYVDWRKQSNQYGTEAEKMASSGLMGTGYSESSQVSMYNTYQNRVATARESFERATVDYNNAINEAKLQNNSALAEIAYKAYQERLTLSLEGFQYKNNLVLELADKKLQLEQMRDNNWYKVLDQINTENAMAQSDRQFYERLDFDAEQNKLKMDFEAAENQLDRDFEKRMEEIKQQYSLDLINAQTKADKEMADYNYNIKKKELADELANDKALLQYEYDLQKKNSSTTISKSSGSSSKTFSETASGNASVGQIKKDSRKPNFTGSTYNEAVSFLKSIGWNRASGIMTMGEWSRRKNAGSTATEVKNYKTYEAYLKAYCAYAVAEKYG